MLLCKHDAGDEAAEVVYLILLHPSPTHGATAPSRPVPPRCRGFTITFRHTKLARTPLDEWWARPDNTQHSQQTSMTPRGIRNRNPSKRAATDPRLRPRSHWDRSTFSIELQNPITLNSAHYFWKSLTPADRHLFSIVPRVTHFILRTTKRIIRN